MPANSRWVGEALFGLYDGLMTSLGVILGSSHASHHLILEIAVCVALTGALSMGTGVLIEDDTNGPPEAVAMGFATMIGTFVPALPVLFLPFAPAMVLTAILALAVAGIIGRVRGGKRRDYLVTLATLLVVAVPTIGVALLFGA